MRVDIENQGVKRKVRSVCLIDQSFKAIVRATLRWDILNQLGLLAQECPPIMSTNCAAESGWIWPKRFPKFNRQTVMSGRPFYRYLKDDFYRSGAF